MHRIYLTGFMGSGKSFTGSALSRKLVYPFLDLDELIEQRENRTIGTIFKEEGEDYFRQLEAKILRTTNRLPLAIIATGGGVPCFNNNIEWMNEHGTTVFLDASPEVLVERLRTETSKRPLISQVGDLERSIRERLSERRKYYERAHIHLSVTNPDTDVARLLANQLAQITGH